MVSDASGSRKTLIVVAVVGLAIVAGVTGLVLMTSGAKVVGATPADRIACAYRIAADRPWGAADALADAARTYADAGVRAAAVACLARFIGSGVRPTIEAAAADPAGEVRAAAAKTLGAFGDAQAAKTLAKLIEADGDLRVRLAAIPALARCDDPRAIVVLLDLAEKGDRIEMKRPAMDALLGRFRARLGKQQTPANLGAWRNLIQRLKGFQAIKDAYAALGVELVQRPQDKIGVETDPPPPGEGP